MLNFSLKVTPSTETKLVVSVTKKVAKKAVTRNLIRRRVKAILRDFPLKSAIYTIFAKVGAQDVRGKELESQLRTLFKL